MVLFGMYYFFLRFFKFPCVGICWVPFTEEWCFFKKLSRFLQATNDSHGTLHLPLSLVGMYSAVACIWAVTNFSHSSFKVCLSYVSWRVSNLFITVIVYLLFISLLVSENQFYREAFTVFSYFCINSYVSLLRRFYDQKILLRKKGMPHSYSILVYEYIM